MRQSTFNMFVKKTISSNFIHFALILIEYICCIFPSTINAVLRIMHSSKTIDDFKKNAIDIEMINILKYTHIPQSMIIQLIFAGIAFLLIIIYIWLYFIGITQNNRRVFKCMRIIIANTYDIVFFRYFSIVIYDSLLMFYITFSTNKDHVFKYISILIIIFLLVFIYCHFSFINKCFVLMNISNPQLVDSHKHYPYDQVSKSYDSMILVMKLLGAWEYNEIQQLKVINPVIYIIDTGILLVSFLLFLKLYLIDTVFYWNISYSYTNKVNNYLKISLSIFNWMIICFVYFFQINNNSLQNFLATCILSINMTLGIIWLTYYLITKYHLIGIPITYDLVLLMILQVNGVKSIADLKSLQDSSLQRHKLSCNNDIMCYLCRNYSTKSEDNIKLFFKYLNKSHNISHCFTKELIKLIYFKLKKKIFKFYEYYYYLIMKYSKLNNNYSQNLRMICEIWFQSHDNDLYNEIMNYVLQVNDFENKMKALLFNMNTFFHQHITLKTPENIINLSNDLSYVTSKIKGIIEKNHSLSGLYAQLNPTIKNISGIINYNMMIFRYILENLMNQSIISLLPLNIENHEDSFHNHFQTDHLIICSIDLNALFTHEIKIIKATGKIIDYNYTNITCLNDYFPAIIRKEGIEKFYKLINTAQSDKTDALCFSFPFTKKGIIQYYKYSFYLTKISKNSELITFGHFVKYKQKNLLLDMSHPHVIIRGFCKEMLKIMHFKIQWIQLLKQINIGFYLNTIFPLIKKHHDEEKEYVYCEFSYREFHNNMFLYYKELRNNREFQSHPDNETQLSTAIFKLKQRFGEVIKIRLEKEAEYNSSIFLYKIKIQSVFNNTHINGQSKANHSLTGSDNELNNYYLYNLNSTTNSASSASHEQSIFSTYYLANLHITKYTIIDNELKDTITKEDKKLTLFTFITIILNLLLIILCIVFLFTQINQTKKLTDISQLYLQFKGIRWIVPNFFLSIVTTVCFTPSEVPVDFCENTYQKYSDDFILNSNMPKEYDFLLYLSHELRCKAETVLNIFTEFKELLFNSRNTEFHVLLDNTINYYLFQENVTTASLVMYEITFEEGLRNYINTVLLITKHIKDDPFYTYPIYFINFENGLFVFRNNIGKYFNDIQKNIYIIMTNYINFFNSFSKGDIKFTAKFDSLSISNNVMNIIFMSLMASCNLFIFFLCKQNLTTAYYIFKILISNVVYQTETKHFSQNVISKMDNLLLLIKLYKRNPNHIIKKISKIKPHSLIVKKAEIDPEVNQVKDKRPFKHKLSFGTLFHQFILGRLEYITYYSFALFCAIMITFDVILIMKFESLMDLFNYTILNYNLDHSLMTNLALSSLIYFGNITNEDLSLATGLENTIDGIPNNLIKINLDMFVQLLTQTTEASKFDSFENGVGYDCNSLFESFNEICSTRTSEVLGLDYRIAGAYICSKFSLLHLPNFNYLRGDISVRNHDMVNKYSKRDYATLYDFSKDYELLDIYTMLLVMFRPLSNFYKDTVHIPNMTNSFNFYVTLVGLYLGVNICLQILMFITIKWGINEKIRKIQFNLYLINNCVV